MMEPTLKTKVEKADKKLTYIVGYRNLFNFAVLMIASMSLYFADVLTSPYLYMMSMIFYVLGFHWTLAQIYANIDSTDVVDTLAATKE